MKLIAITFAVLCFSAFALADKAALKAKLATLAQSKTQANDAA